MSIPKETPGPGQESVWDYPRPPALERCTRRIRVVVDGATIVDTCGSYRVLETSHPPTYYLPPDALRGAFLSESGRASFCEWKGQARYYDLHLPRRVISDAAWSYPLPTAEFTAIRDYVAFYPHKLDACFVDELPVRAQAGGFYGGWITSDIVGPFKGEQGTMGW